MRNIGVLGPKHSFYDILAGALIGGGIEIAATAAEEIITKGLMVAIFRFAAVASICVAGGFLIRIARMLERIERAYEAGRPGLIDQLVKRGREQKEIDVELQRFRRDLEEEKGTSSVASFSWAVGLVALAGILFFASSLPLCQIIRCIISFFQSL